MPTLNEFTLNGPAVNGGDLPSLPATAEELSMSCGAEWETLIPGPITAVWELSINSIVGDIPAQWELTFAANLED